MYSERMLENFKNTKSYFEEDDLRKMHNNVKNESHARVSYILYYFIILIILSSMSVINVNTINNPFFIAQL